MADDSKGTEDSGHDDNDLADLLQEIRVLLQGVQVLTAFLIILPFNEGFNKIDQLEKWVYTITFVCSVSGLVLMSAPAAHHRISRPLMDREHFKNFATKMIIAGLIPSSVALVLATQLVVSQVFGGLVSLMIAVFVGLMIGVFWWVLPLTHKNREQG